MLDVAIIGAGPYGLSAAAHLRSVPGLDVQVFGDPMVFWRRNMPAGMLLRSPWAASHFSDPAGSCSLDAFVAERGAPVPRPIPLEAFLEYGRWFQRTIVPDVDRRRVSSVHRERKCFRLELETGRSPVNARRVVVAAGIGPFAWIPAPFLSVAPDLASHSSCLRDPALFRGKQVVVVGAGQSALEYAALLREAGAAGVEILARRPGHFLNRSGLLHSLGPLTGLLYAPSDVGPAVVSRVAAAPSLFRRLPRPLHDAWRRASTRPAGATWLPGRLAGVTTTIGVTVNQVEAGPEGLALLLSDGSMRCVDHAILATGYRIDIGRYPFLPAGLLQQVKRVDGYPCLTDGLESSVPGLHFMGGPAGWTFGPLLHFVAGARFAARELARVVAGPGSAARAPAGEAA